MHKVFRQIRSELVSMATGSPYNVKMVKTTSPSFSAVFDRIRLILAGNHDMRENLDVFEIRQDWHIENGVSCP